MLDQLEPFLIPGDSPSMFFGGTLATMSSRVQEPRGRAQALLEFLTSPARRWPPTSSAGTSPPSTSCLTSDYVTSNKLVQFAMENLDVAKHEGGPAQWLEIRGDFTAGAPVGPARSEDPAAGPRRSRGTAQTAMNSN